MNPSAVALAILLSTSAILSATMGVAWAHFGRQRHALTLAFAYGSGLVHWSIDAIGLLWFPGNPAIIGTATVFTIITSTLVAMACRQRSLLPEYFGRFALAAGLTAVAILAVSITDIHVAMRAVLPCLYSAVMMAVVISELRRKTDRKSKRASRLTAPEIAFIAGLGCVAYLRVRPIGRGWCRG